MEAASKQFKNAPKKALGYFLDSLWEARYVRAFLYMSVLYMLCVLFMCVSIRIEQNEKHLYTVEQCVFSFFFICAVRSALLGCANFVEFRE